jgi:hypothetical protein
MMLGDLLREAQQAAAVLDPALRARIEAAGQAPGPFAQAAVVAFERYATEEHWATMLSTARRAVDPGKACLETMVRWQLERSGRRAPADRPEDEGGSP